MKKLFLICIILIGITACLDKENIQVSLPEKKDYSYLNIKSNFDYNQDGEDDFTDFVIGGRKEAKVHPRYDGAYIGVNKGYPEKDTGVCTDVIWRAFKEAGYSLRSMVNQDIRKYPSDYPMVEVPNGNIDFRRVKTIRPFFEKYCEVLSNDLEEPKDWQPGDIVIFNPNDYHIGILSDKRNSKGYPYVFHNEGQLKREEDFLRQGKVSGHFRFKGENIDQNVLKPWITGEAGQSNE